MTYPDVQKKLKIRQARTALQYRDIGDSGIAIDDGEAQRDDFGLGGIVYGSQLKFGKIDRNGNQIQTIAK